MSYKSRCCHLCNSILDNVLHSLQRRISCAANSQRSPFIFQTGRLLETGGLWQMSGVSWWRQFPYPSKRIDPVRFNPIPSSTSGKRCSVRVLLRSKMARGGLQVGSEATSMLHVILALPLAIFVSSFTGNNNQLCFLWCTKFSVAFIRLVFPATYFNSRLSDLYDPFSRCCFSFSYEIVTSPDLKILIRLFFYFCCFTLNIIYRHIDHYNW